MHNELRPRTIGDSGAATAHYVSCRFLRFEDLRNNLIRNNPALLHICAQLVALCATHGICGNCAISATLTAGSADSARSNSMEIPGHGPDEGEAQD